jgi:hypothetical protein
MDKGIIERSKRPTKDSGRPRFVYRLSGDIGGLALSALLDTYKGLVVISFDRLWRLCRHENGSYCKELRGSCAPQYCPQIEK